MRLFHILFLIAFSTVLAKKRRSSKTKSKINNEIKTEPVQELSRRADTFFDAYNRPVPFGHIYKEGFEDPNGEMKQPIDLLELDTIFVHDGPLARELIENRKLDYQRVITSKNRDKVKGDVLRVEIPENKAETPEYRVDTRNDTIRTYWDMATIQQRNLFRRPQSRTVGQTGLIKGPVALDPDYEGKSKYFSKGSYGLEEDKENSVRHIDNFTTCDEFGKNAQFHPNDIVNVEWVPFYIWTHELMGRVTISRVHKFTYPTKKIVEEFKRKYSTHLNKTIDWEQPKLYLKDDMDLLLIATDRKGLFEGIPHHDIPEYLKNKPNVTIPTLTIRLKIVDPYLGMMYCDHQYATIMAVVGTEPKTKQAVESEAALLKIKGPGFAIKRDLIMERLEARAKKIEETAMKQEKVITLEEQMNPTRIRNYKKFNY